MSKKFPQYVRKVVGGKMVKPVSDAYVAVVTKFYSPDQGGMSAKTWIYDSADSTVEMMPMGLLITQTVRGREQHVFTPYTEVLRVDFNDASPAYQEDRILYMSETTGMSPDEVEEMQERGRRERILNHVAEQLHMPVDNIGFLTEPDEHIGFWTEDGDNDGK